MVRQDDNGWDVGQREKRNKTGKVLSDEKKGAHSEWMKQGVDAKYEYEVNNLKKKNGSKKVYYDDILSWR